MAQVHESVHNVTQGGYGSSCPTCTASRNHCLRNTVMPLLLCITELSLRLFGIYISIRPFLACVTSCFLISTQQCHRVFETICLIFSHHHSLFEMCHDPIAIIV